VSHTFVSFDDTLPVLFQIFFFLSEAAAGLQLDALGLKKKLLKCKISSELCQVGG
jgi:hypothetical protein